MCLLTTRPLILALPYSCRQSIKYMNTEREVVLEILKVLGNDKWLSELNVLVGFR